MCVKATGSTKHGFNGLKTKGKSPFTPQCTGIALK